MRPGPPALSGKRPSLVFADYSIDDKRTSIVSSSVLLFSILEGVASFVLPIINAFGHPLRMSPSLCYEIFSIIQLTVSIVAVGYLQGLLTYYERRQNRPLQQVIRSINYDVREKVHDKVPRVGMPRRAVDASDEGDIECVESLSPRVVDRLEVQSTTDSYSVECDRSGQSDDLVTQRAKEEEKAEPAPRLMKAFKITPRRSQIRSLGRIFKDAFKQTDRREPPLDQHPNGSNLYLRLGAVVFGFGVMVMDGFRVADWQNGPEDTVRCHSVLWIPANVIHAIYIFWQTYFIFKYHRTIFNVQKFLVRLILSHMTVVNLGQWLSTVVQEVTAAEGELENIISPNLLIAPPLGSPPTPPDAVNASSPRTYGCYSRVSMFAHYLIPCGVEYSLIACAIFFKMLQRVGNVLPKEADDRPTSYFAVEASGGRIPNLRRIRRYKQGEIINKYWNKDTECENSHKGLFLGLLALTATLVALALFYNYLQNHRRTEAFFLYQITDITLLAISLATGGVALFQLRALHLRELSEEAAFDDNLLLIGLLGMLFYDLFLLVPASELAALWIVGKAVLEMAQALLQVFFILEASRRQVGTLEQALKKPGRTIITLLLMLNLAMWIVNTFELKHAENHPIHRSYYTTIVWKVITRLSLPLLIFFRFHSSICLANVWTNMYHYHHKVNV